LNSEVKSKIGEREYENGKKRTKVGREHEKVEKWNVKKWKRECEKAKTGT